uniref:Uncharacterized protein n=1 Tax=Kapraunia schneideri TaxID=717899 RepID=A0A1Z1MSY7_9FLOR|nr:hypothetical protein [Kapraunia schneideri]ARW68824.1 hypothetical protein [Kapraunia schneideri]
MPYSSVIMSISSEFYINRVLILSGLKSSSNKLILFRYYFGFFILYTKFHLI